MGLFEKRMTYKQWEELKNDMAYNEMVRQNMCAKLFEKDSLSENVIKVEFRQFKVCRKFSEETHNGIDFKIVLTPLYMTEQEQDKVFRLGYTVQQYTYDNLSVGDILELHFTKTN